MTLREENQQLREKISEYEELLEEINNGPQQSGTISSKIGFNMVRVTSDDGNDVILKFDPKLKGNIKEGTRVLFNKIFITQILPEELEKTPEEVQFDYIEWNQIAGIQSQLKRIQEAINAPTLYHKYYKEYGLTPCKGILLYGPAGCGKTMVAKAIASSFLKGKEITKDCFIYMKGGEMLSPYVGMAENNIKSAFVRARRNYKKTGNRSIIFIDEAEAILPARGSRRSSDVETTIVPTFLSEMDGFEENGTFVILATNYPNQIDEAVRRPGRIDLQIEISRPNQDDAADIFALYLGKTKCKDCDSVAIEAAVKLFTSSIAPKASGALIKNIVDTAALFAVKRAATQNINNGVTTDDIFKAIEELC